MEKSTALVPVDDPSSQVMTPTNWGKLPDCFGRWLLIKLEPQLDQPWLEQLMNGKEDRDLSDIQLKAFIKALSP